MERDPDLQEGLRRSNARFLASMNSILDQYNHPFEDDLLVSMDTLTYDTPDGPKQWGQVSRKDVKKLKKKIFKLNRRSQRNTEISKQQSSDFEDQHSAVDQESSESSGVDTSDIGEESGGVVSVRRKCEDTHLQNLNVDDGQILKKQRVRVDLILQGDERKIPKWITMTAPDLSKIRPLPVQEVFGNQAAVCRKKRELSNEPSSSKYLQLQHSGVPSSSNTISSPRHQPCPEPSKTSCDSIHEEYQSADEGCSWSNKTLADLYPAMVEIFTRLMAKSSQRKVLKYMFGHLRSKRRHSRRRKLKVTVDNMRGLEPCKLKKAFHGICSYRNEDKQNPTFGDESREFCYDNCLIGNSSGLAPYTDTNEIEMDYSDSSLEQHLVSGKGQKVSKHRAFPEVMDRMGVEYSDSSLEQHLVSGKGQKVSKHRAFPEVMDRMGVEYSDSSSEQHLASGKGQKVSKHRAFPEVMDRMGVEYSDSSLEQHLASGKGQKVSKHRAFPEVVDRMGETFLVEDELDTTASPKNSEYAESKKLAYKRFSEHSFITPTASSNSRAIHLAKESKTQKTDFSSVGASELSSSACSSHGNSNNSIPIGNHSPARSSTAVFIYPGKTIPERQTSFQHKDSFSSWFMKQSPSKKPHKYEDAFEELYYKACSEEFQKPLTLTKPLVNSQNLGEKGSLVKSNSSDFVMSAKQCDIEFDRLYEQLCGKSAPKFPGFQTTPNLRKHEEIKMPETVNALVNSPVRAYSAISRVKRAGSSQNYVPCSPLKRLKLVPDTCFSSGECQEISHSKEVNLQTAGMDFSSTYNCSNPRFADHNCRCQDSGIHDSSDKSFLAIPGTSLQESRTAGAHSGWPGAMENCSCHRIVRKCHHRVYRELSYTDEKDQL